MEDALTLDDVRRAAAARDPELAQLVAALASAPGRAPAPPPREGAPSYADLLTELQSHAFKTKPPEVRREIRLERLRVLEAVDAEVPLPERLRLHEVLLDLWADDGAYARPQLLRIIADVPLVWGPWRALKRIFKEAEAKGDFEVFGALAARFDVAFADRSARGGEVSKATLGYLVRRAWRTMRRVAVSLPAAWPDLAVEVLRFYPEHTRWGGTWVANHIFHHRQGGYTRRRFRLKRRTGSLLKGRAHPALWRRSPRPLFALLERARAEQARRFAVEALKSDFRANLREVEPSWVARLVDARSQTVDAFVVWLLGDVPRFRQDAFRALGLHAPVLRLFDSPAAEARAYAAAYARTHVRDLPLDALIRLANNEHDGVRAMVRDLLGDRDPRDEVGLEGWGRLLGTEYGHDLAAAAIRKHFGARELTPDWFAARLRAEDERAVAFAIELLPRVHSTETLGPAWFVALLDAPELDWEATAFALDALEGLGPERLDPDDLRRLLLHGDATDRVRGWIEEERVSAATLGASFMKAVAFEATWAADPWIAELRTSGRGWARHLEFDPDLSAFALGLLSDVRRFGPEQLGFAWLMRLVERSEARYHAFAVDYMTRAFVPADFAESAPAERAAPSEADLGAASFLFTGKLSTMTRAEAKKKVSGAGGRNASGVNARLDYLVIGDEGSPLYGAGRKGSKQLKAEKLIADGAGLRIISETAFLQMLAGEQRSFDEEAVIAGAERLWSMAFGPGAADAPLARFARHYLRLHHPEIAPLETDRHVDPGAEIPTGFLSFERVKPLLADPREPMRRAGLEWARFELNGWRPPMRELVELSELPFPEVGAFVRQALTSEDAEAPRIDPAVLTVDGVYRFCESLAAETRALGMLLVARHPRLAEPDALFRLTESPDRQVRAFAVRQLWALYRRRGVTRGWKPAPRPEGSSREAGVGAPERPQSPPAAVEDVRDFLRRTLFGVPPARPPKKGSAKGRVGLRPLPARKAKLALIETVRDLALEDAELRARVRPLLEEFLVTRGQTERAACLVALTRLRAAEAPE